MEGILFINEAINAGIKNYLQYKEKTNNEEFNSFMVVVIRALIKIYGELDIVNPYKTNNESGFDANLKKFGLKDEVLAEFKSELLNFYQNTEVNEISINAFLNVQKILIDMFILRKSHVVVSDEELEAFKNLLYTKTNADPAMFVLYSKYTPESDTVINYLNNKLFEMNHHYEFTEYKEVALSADAYQLAGYNVVEVLNMKDEEIEDINNKVYHFFRIKESDLNKRSRLADAVQYYKKYGNSITSGNGYVDLLLLLSVIATGMMILIMVGINFMG